MDMQQALSGISGQPSERDRQMFQQQMMQQQMQQQQAKGAPSDRDIGMFQVPPQGQTSPFVGAQNMPFTPPPGGMIPNDFIQNMPFDQSHDPMSQAEMMQLLGGNKQTPYGNF